MRGLFTIILYNANYFNRASNNSRNRRIISFTYIMRPLNSRFDSAGRQKAKLMHNQWSGIETRRSRAINATVVTPMLRMSIARLKWFRSDMVIIVDKLVRQEIEKTRFIERDNSCTIKRFFIEKRKSDFSYRSIKI